MPPPAVTELLYLLDQAFDGNDEHSLLANLASVRPGDWLARVAGGRRTVRDIAAHAGVAKYLYADHLFGAATLSYVDAMRASPALDDTRPIEDTLAWLRDGHRQLRDGLGGLTDDELARQRRTHWGELAETRWILTVIIQHDVYHAGEINHLRALHQGDDRWPWEAGG